MILECFFGLEDAVVENLFIVLQAHCDRYERKILNVKLESNISTLLICRLLATDSAHYACETTVFFNGKYSNTTYICET